MTSCCTLQICFCLRSCLQAEQLPGVPRAFPPHTHAIPPTGTTALFPPAIPSVSENSSLPQVHEQKLHPALRPFPHTLPAQASCVPAFLIPQARPIPCIHAAHPNNLLPPNSQRQRPTAATTATTDLTPPHTHTHQMISLPQSLSPFSTSSWPLVPSSMNQPIITFDFNHFMPPACPPPRPRAPAAPQAHPGHPHHPARHPGCSRPPQRCPWRTIQPGWTAWHLRRDKQGR